MIVRTPHLTTGYDPTLTAQIAKTRPGMAHWAASGPFGRTCGDCGYLGYQQQIQNAIGVVVATKQRHGCAKFLALTGRHGANVPRKPRRADTSSRGRATPRARMPRRFPGRPTMHLKDALKNLIADALQRHVAAATEEMASAMTDEIKALPRDRLADLRTQLESGDEP